MYMNRLPQFGRRHVIYKATFTINLNNSIHFRCKLTVFLCFYCLYSKAVTVERSGSEFWLDIKILGEFFNSLRLYPDQWNQSFWRWDSSISIFFFNFLDGSGLQLPESLGYWTLEWAWSSSVDPHSIIWQVLTWTLESTDLSLNSRLTLTRCIHLSKLLNPYQPQFLLLWNK